MIQNLETQQQKSKRLSKILLTGIFFTLGLTMVQASDHLDKGLFNINHDLSDFYAFKSPTNDKNIVFVLNYHPKANKNANWFSQPTMFSQEHKFVVALRNAKIGASGAKTAFVLGDTEYRFSCVFAKPTEDDEKIQTGNCVAPSGESLSVTVNDKHGSQGYTFKVFAGLRSDPFFMAARKVLKHFKSNSTDYPNPGSNDVAGHNILSIVIEANIQANFSTLDTRLFAVRSEMLTLNTQPTKRLDSIGRPEVTNMVIGVPCLKILILNKSICDDFNQQDTFLKDQKNKKQIMSKINLNLKRWDNMDKQVDWPLVDDNHPLSELIYADYLVMDFAKSFNESSYFEIESSLLAEKQHTTSGGRWLNEDVIDKILTMYISRGNKHYSDFVNNPTKAAEKSFPYVRSPN